MTELQKDLFMLGAIIILNIIITLLHKKYKNQQQTENKEEHNFNKNWGLVKLKTLATSVSYFPKIPFLILSYPKNYPLKRIIIIHNILCFLVYALFIIAIVFFCRKN